MFDGFWQLVVDQNVSLIVMITKRFESRKRKAHQYWPDERYKDFRLQNGIKVREEDEDETKVGFCKRTLKVTGKGELYHIY